MKAAKSLGFTIALSNKLKLFETYAIKNAYSKIN